MYQGKFLAENRAAAKAEPKKAVLPTADEIMDEELAAQQAEEATPVAAEKKAAKPAKAEKKAKKEEK